MRTEKIPTIDVSFPKLGTVRIFSPDSMMIYSDFTRLEAARFIRRLRKESGRYVKFVQAR